MKFRRHHSLSLVAFFYVRVGRAKPSYLLVVAMNSGNCGHKQQVILYIGVTLAFVNVVARSALYATELTI